MMKKKEKPEIQEEILTEDTVIPDEVDAADATPGEDIPEESENVTEDSHEKEINEESKETMIEELKNTLTESQTKAEEYLDGWQRSMAEFANYKKRIHRERAEFQNVARGEIIKGYLEIVDDLERALQERPQKGEGARWSEGIEIIYKKLLAKLEAEGVKPMKALGEEFDPNIHEALMQQESEEHTSGEIIEVLQEGYWIGEKVLRPALVKIAA